MCTNFRTCCAAEFYRIDTAHEVLTSVLGQTLAHYLEHARADRRTKSFGGRRTIAASVLQHRDACCKSAAKASVSAAAATWCTSPNFPALASHKLCWCAGFAAGAIACALCCRRSCSRAPNPDNQIAGAPRPRRVSGRSFLERLVHAESVPHLQGPKRTPANHS